MNLQEQIAFFEKNDYCVFPNALSPAEVGLLNAAIDRNRAAYPGQWGSGDRQQSVHCILTQPEFDPLIRHPSLMPLAAAALDGDVVFSEFSVMIRAGSQDVKAAVGTGWHRDTPVNPHQRLGINMLSAIYYLTDVDQATARYTLIPGSHTIEQAPRPVAEGSDDFVNEKEMLGKAGTCILVNSGIWHRGKIGPGPRERRTVHTYYQPSSLPQCSGHNIFPRRLWDVSDPAQRKFYSHFNEITRAVAEDYAREMSTK